MGGKGSGAALQEIRVFLVLCPSIIQQFLTILCVLMSNMENEKVQELVQSQKKKKKKYNLHNLQITLSGYQFYTPYQCSVEEKEI